MHFSEKTRIDASEIFILKQAMDLCKQIIVSGESEGITDEQIEDALDELSDCIKMYLNLIDGMYH